jgi:outer membrane immunogenic protein
MMLMAGLALAALSAPALAQGARAADSTGPTFYVTGGYTHYDDADLSFGGVTGRGGVAISENWGFEVEYTIGSGKSDALIPVSGFGNVQTEIGVDSQISGFVVGYLPLGDKWTGIGRLGYSSLTLDVETRNFSNIFIQNISTTVDFDDFAWGVGAEYHVNERFGIRGDITGFQAEGDTLDSGLTLFQIGGVVRF